MPTSQPMQPPTFTTAEGGPGLGEAHARVLIVDDEPAIGRALSRLLERDLHEVLVVGRAEDALQLLLSDRFDVILCDVTMPGMTGIELYERLASERPDVAERIVFLTGGTFTDAAEAFFRDSVRSVLVKPIDAAAVRALVQERARRR
jgi:CheY-like chemotaxis protein